MEGRFEAMRGLRCSMLHGAANLAGEDLKALGVGQRTYSLIACKIAMNKSRLW